MGKATIRVVAAAVMAAVATLIGSAAEPYRMDWDAQFRAVASDGTFSPYYLGSNRYGVTGASPDAVYMRAGIRRAMNDSTRFSYGFGVDLTAGYFSEVDYLRILPDGTRTTHGVNAGYWYPQQLYAEVRYRSLFLTAGMREFDRSIYPALGSGDLVMSRNARPVPQVRIGFTRFTDVPLTRGWLQVQAELAYGRFIDSGWLRRQAAHQYSFVTTGVWLHYKRLLFRVGERQPLAFTVGLEHAGQFGGHQTSYLHGEVVGKRHFDAGLKQWLKMLIPKQGEGSAYYDGNHLGSWDAKLRYRFRSGDELEAYVQFPWEDGSGIGKLNGFDGVWGLHYQRSTPWWIDGAVAEYIDLTNQSGPMHWAPGDTPGTGIPGQATGSDDYYNNFAYDGWANYGMSMGTPFVKSPAYNANGYPRFADNRVRGFHLGITGSPAAAWGYTVYYSFRTSWGTPSLPAVAKRRASSFMAEAVWKSPLPGFSVDAAVAFDHGKLYGNCFGASVGISYIGSLAIKTRKK